MKISTTWIKHLKEKDKKEEFLNTILMTAVPALRRLQDIIKDELSKVKTLSGGKEAYKDPNWAVFQADALGEQRAYNKILKLINIEDK